MVPIVNAVVDKPVRSLFRLAGVETLYNKLVAPYFARPQSQAALGAIALTNASIVGAGVFFNYLNRDLFNDLAARNLAGFSQDMTQFAVGLLGFAGVAITRSYITGRLRLSWNIWAKDEAMREWLSPENRGQLIAIKGDLQPEQRIANDISDFIGTCEPLSIGFATNASNFAAYTIVLFHVSPLLYVGTVVLGAGGAYVLHAAGKELVHLNHQSTESQNRYRNSIVIANRHATDIALSGGEEATQEAIRDHLLRTRKITLRYINVSARLDAIRMVYSNLAAIFPFLLSAPAYFQPSSTLKVGDITLGASASANVREALDWYSSNQSAIVVWRAAAKRLNEFLESCVPSQKALAKSPLYHSDDTLGLTVKNLRLMRPDNNGNALCENISFDLKPGDRLVITGDSGSGKSTLFKTLRGLLTHQNGEIIYSGACEQVGEVIFVPQDPYIPDVPLAKVLAYPGKEGTFSSDDMHAALTKVGLSSLVEYINNSDVTGNNFGLSGGERQRLNFARLLLHKPSVIGLDEATSSLPTADSVAMHQLLFNELPDSIIVSIAHRPELIPLHTKQGKLTAENLFISDLNQEMLSLPRTSIDLA